MEEYVDDLIVQARQDIKEAQKRLTMLISIKKRLSVENKTTTVKEASQMLGISERSIRTWLSSGKLKGQRVGKYYAVDIDSIKEALAGK